MQLERDKKLYEYNIQKDSVLHMVMRLRGGMYDPTSGRQDLEELDAPEKEEYKRLHFEILGLKSNLQELEEMIDIFGI